MSIKKSTFYLTGHEITLRSDHLPLNKFLRKMTLNQMVNNWSTEIESFNNNFVHISGKDNVLADTLSQLIDTDPDLKQQPELEGHEFGKYCFETLPKVRGSAHHERIGGDEFDMCEIQITYDNPENSELSVELPLEDEKFISCRSRTQKFGNFMTRLKKGMYHEFYLVKNNVLFRSIVDNGHKFEGQSYPRLTGGCSAPSRPQPVWTQWIPEDICSNQAFVLLERYEGTNFAILQKLQGLCTTKGAEDAV